MGKTGPRNGESGTASLDPTPASPGERWPVGVGELFMLQVNKIKDQAPANDELFGRIRECLCVPHLTKMAEIPVMARHCVFIVLLAFSTTEIQAGEANSPRLPYGQLSEEDFEHLHSFGVRKGVDLAPVMARIYSREKQLDDDALGRFFMFSRSLERLNTEGRAYGQMILNIFDYVGEGYGVEAYGRVLDRQPADVRQRIRNFLFYPYSKLPPQEREEAYRTFREVHPAVFLKDFIFGRDDHLFAE
ncbi:MAG: hypothetical protein ACR2NX_11655 [Chthoniobacterales bacterium]